MINATRSIPTPITIRLADDGDLARVYRLRHDVFAAELHQHSENDTMMLHDSRYDSDLYIVAERGHELLGCVCITPPEHPYYAVERYFARARFPFSTSGLYEVRLLTVAPHARKLGLSKALIGAAMRWLDEHEATRVVVTGHGWTRFFYQVLGFEPTDLSTVSGDLELVLMSGRMTHLWATSKSRWARVVDQFEQGIFDWQLEFPLDPSLRTLPKAA